MPVFTDASRFLLPFSLLITWLVWGSTYLAIRYGIASFPPLLLGAVRFTVAGVVMVAFLRRQGAPWPTLRQWRNAGWIGFLMLSLGNGAVCIAEQWVASGMAALLVATAPLFAVLVGRFWGHRAGRLEWLGIVLGLVGVGVLNLDGQLQAQPVGVLLVLAAAAIWSLASVWIPHLDMPAGGMSAAAQMLVGGLALWLMAPLRGEVWPATILPSAWFALAYLTLMGSIVAYSAYVYVLHHARPALATSYAYINPVTALLLGWLIAGETLAVSTLWGMAVILAGVVLLSLQGKAGH